MEKIFNFFKTHKTEVIIFVFILLIKFTLFSKLHISISPDSMEYLNINGFNIFLLKPHEYRLPLYPILINICNFITKEHFINLLCYIQFLLSCLSIFYLYKTFKSIGNNKYINFILILIYSVSNCIYSWDKLVLTESISLSLSVFIIYHFVRYIYTKNIKNFIFMLTFTTLCIFIKPNSATMIFAILTLYLINYLFIKKERVICIKNFILTLIPCLIILIYATVFYFNYGNFSISNSHLANNLDVFVDKTNLYQLGFNKDMINIIDNAKDINSFEYKEYRANNSIIFLGRDYKFALNKKYTNNEILNFINEIKFSYPLEYLKYICYKFKYNLSAEFVGYGMFAENQLAFTKFNIFPIYIWEVLLISCVLFILILFDFIKNKTFNKTGIFIFTNIIFIFAVTVLGNINIEMPRLCLLSVPLTFVALSIIIYKLFAKKYLV